MPPCSGLSIIRIILKMGTRNETKFNQTVYTSVSTWNHLALLAWSRMLVVFRFHLLPRAAPHTDRGCPQRLEPGQPSVQSGMQHQADDGKHRRLRPP